MTMVEEYLDNETALIRAMLVRLSEDASDGATWCALADVLSESGTELYGPFVKRVQEGDAAARCHLALTAALASCHPHTRCTLESIWDAPHYCEPGYTPPAAGLVVVGNWNETDRYDHDTKTRVKVDDTPRILGDILEALGAETEWCDEWAQCDGCQGAVRTQPDGYDWEPFFTLADDEVACTTCRDKEAREERVSFFYNHAGWSQGAGETPAQGRQRSAESLADAEEWFHSQGGTVEWVADNDADRSWLIDPETGPEGGDDGRTLWGCIVTLGDRNASLWSIDLGPDGYPADGFPSGTDPDNYARVVVAELADELRAAQE